MKRLTRSLVLAALAAWVVPTAAQDLGRFKDWSAHQFTEDGKRLCLMFTQPKKDEGNYKRRGEIFALVSHRPDEQQFGVVSFEMGYPFAPGKELSVSIDGGGVDPHSGRRQRGFRRREHLVAQVAGGWSPARQGDAGRPHDGGHREIEARDEDGRYLLASRVLGGLQGHLARLRRTLSARPAAVTAGILEARQLHG